MKKQKKINQLFDSMEVAEYFHTFFDINNFNNCSLKHFFALIKDTPLSKKMEIEISKKYNQKIPYSLIVNYVENDYICNNACTNWLKDIMKYMRDNPLYTKKYCGFGNINEIKDIKELYNGKSKQNKYGNYINTSEFLLELGKTKDIDLALNNIFHRY